MKLCKDCRWVTWPWRNIRDAMGAICVHPSVAKPLDERLDPVTGRRQAGHGGMFCDIERRSGGCGLDGKNWEPKRPPEPVADGDDDPPPQRDGAGAGFT